MKRLTDKQIKFLNTCKDIGTVDLIDTGETLWDLTTIYSELGNSFLKWDSDKIGDWYKQKNQKGNHWNTFLLTTWIEDWITDLVYEDDGNDRNILNSLGLYYKRYKVRNGI